jgi:hypothetical protein
MKKNIIDHLPLLKCFFKKEIDFNFESYLIDKYKFISYKKIGVLRGLDNNAEIFINYKSNCVYLFLRGFLILKINFIPKTKLVTDLIIYNSLESIKKNVNSVTPKK